MERIRLLNIWLSQRTPILLHCLSTNESQPTSPARPHPFLLVSFKVPYLLCPPQLLQPSLSAISPSICIAVSLAFFLPACPLQRQSWTNSSALCCSSSKPRRKGLRVRISMSSSARLRRDDWSYEDSSVHRVAEENWGKETVLTVEVKSRNFSRSIFRMAWHALAGQ